MPKNSFFQLTNEFYDLSLKVNANKQCVILPNLKHEMMRTLKFTHDEIEDLKTVFVNYSMKHRGIDFDNFKEMLQAVFGIYDYPFAAVSRVEAAPFQLLRQEK